jgi:O-antigen/teichoic acid export membrane protein
MKTDEPICPSVGATSETPITTSSLVSEPVASAATSTMILCSFADQAFAVGGGFLANVVLARTQSKETYGVFALSYSVFTFLAALHNAAILEPCTVYGSGRYRHRFLQYLRFIMRINVVIGVLLTLLLLSASLFIWWLTPKLRLNALLGLGFTVGILLSGALLRRMFYLQRRPVLAAQTSATYFVIVACGLWLGTKTHILNSFSVFFIFALGWIVAGALFGRKVGLDNSAATFLDSEPGYWREHWKYSKWVFATALVLQLATQGYYWLVAGCLSVKEVGELRATYLIIAPVEQVFIALSLLVLPALATRYASNERQAFLSLVKRYAFGLLATAAIFAGGVRLVGKSALHILYDGRFDDLASLLYLLAFLPLLMAVSNALSVALNAAEKPRLVFYAYASSGVATFGVGIPLVIHFGLAGAVYGMLFSGAVFSGVLFVGVRFGVWKHGLISAVAAPATSRIANGAPAAQEMR